MTTYYDHRAERTMAEAEADARRAQAEALRVETTLRLERERRQMETDRVQQERRAREERERSRTARRENRRRERKQARLARRAAIRRGAGALRTATVQRVPFLVGGVAMGSPIAIAWNGQYQFAEQIMHLGALSPALPISLEGAVWYLAYLTHRAITQHLPTVRYRVATWVLAAVAATMNFWHGSTPKGLPANAPQQLIEQAARDAQQTGVALALASLLGIGLWELTVGLTQHTASRRSLAEIRRAAWRRLRYPRLSWQAASIRAARGEECSIEDAWAAAWIDRYGVGPDAPRRDRRLGRKVMRYRTKADREAAKNGRLAIVNGEIVGRPPVEVSPPNPRGEEAIERLRGWDPDEAARRASRRAARAALSAEHGDTTSATFSGTGHKVPLSVAPQVPEPVSLVPLLPALGPLPAAPGGTSSDTFTGTARVVPLPVPPEVPVEVSEDVPDEEVDAFIAELRDTEADTGSDTETATATATEAMRRYWDQAIKDGRVPTGAELAAEGHCAESYGRRMRRAWLDELDGRTRRRLLGARKATA